MSEDKKAAEAAPASGDGGGGGGSKLTLILTIVNLLITVGVAAVVFIAFKKESKQPRVEDIAVSTEGSADGEKGGSGGEKTADGKPVVAPAKKDTTFGKMITLDQFVINLSTPGTDRPKFFRVHISLEVPTSDTEEEVTQKMPKVRNTVIDLINSKRATDLVTPEGRDYLKEEIRNAVNSFIVTGKVKGVFFTNFAVTG